MHPSLSTSLAPVPPPRPFRPAPGRRRHRWRGALLCVLLPVVVLAGCDRRPTPAQFEHLEHGLSLPAFSSWWLDQQAAAHGVSRATVAGWWRWQPRRFDDPSARRGRWDVSSDLCSVVPDRSPVFDFREACVRHDFGWRNLHRLGRLWPGRIDTRAHRLAVSRQFLADMQELCRRRPHRQRTACLVVAVAYHRGTVLVA